MRCTIPFGKNASFAAGTSASDWIFSVIPYVVGGGWFQRRFARAVPDTFPHSGIRAKAGSCWRAARTLNRQRSDAVSPARSLFATESRWQSPHRDPR